jgi:hypothetical protein
LAEGEKEGGRAEKKEGRGCRKEKRKEGTSGKQGESKPSCTKPRDSSGVALVRTGL